MVCLNYEDTIKFLKKIEEDLKHPVGPVPTPKIDEAIKMIEEEMMGMEADYRWDERHNGITEPLTIVPCKECHEHPCTCKKEKKMKKLKQGKKCK